MTHRLPAVCRATDIEHSAFSMVYESVQKEGLGLAQWDLQGTAPGNLLKEFFMYEIIIF